MKLHNLFSLAACLGAVFSPAVGRIFSGSAMEGFEESANMHLEHLQAARGFMGPPEPPVQNVKRDSTVQFRNPRAKQFFVDGTKIPDGSLLRHSYLEFS